MPRRDRNRRRRCPQEADTLGSASVSAADCLAAASGERQRRCAPTRAWPGAKGDQRQRSSQQGAGLPQCGQSAWNGSDVVVDDGDVVVAMSNPFPPGVPESFPFRKSGSSRIDRKRKLWFEDGWLGRG